MKSAQKLIATLESIEQFLDLNNLEALKNDIPIIKDYLIRLDNFKNNANCTDIVMIFTEDQLAEIRTEIKRIKGF